MKKIIGINGPAGSGKTTFAEYLKYLIKQKDCVIIPFAKPLKEFAKSLGWDGKKDDKGRRLLQLLGTECGRECIDKNIWVKHWYKEIEKLNKNTLVICDDMRFINEINMITELNGVTLKIKGRGYTNIDTAHQSEKIYSDNYFHYIIDNSGTLLDLKKQAQGFINEVRL